MKDWLIEMTYDKHHDDYLTQARLIQSGLKEMKRHWEQWERRSQQLTKEARLLRKELEEMIDSLSFFEQPYQESIVSGSDSIAAALEE
jgi:hypothetical protein